MCSWPKREPVCGRPEPIRLGSALWSWCAALLVIWCWPSAGTLTCLAQDASNPPTSQTNEFKVVIKVVNGTTGQPGRADRVSLHLLKSSRGPLDTAVDVEGEVNFYSVPLVGHRDYLAEAWVGDVPYYAQAKGRQLEQQPLTVHVFDTTTELAGLTVKGMNLVIRRAEDQLQLEYLWTIVNETSPQRSVVPGPVTLELMVAAGAAPLVGETHSRPAMTTLAVQPGSGRGWSGIVVPLTPGQTRLRVTTTLPYSGQAQIPLGANLAIEQWSVLAFPRDMEVSGEGLTSPTGDAEADFRRFTGEALEAGDHLLLTVSGGTGPQVAARAEGPADTLEMVPDPQESVEQSRSSSVLWIMLFVVVAIVYIFMRRRIRS